MYLQNLHSSYSGIPLLWRGCLRNGRSLSVTSTLATLRTPWTEREDDLITKHRSDGKSVADIRSEFLPHRSLMAIYGRLHRITNEALLKTGKWTKEEDEYLIRKITHIHSSGRPVKWRDLAMNLGRSSRVVRERWRNKLDPQICHKPFTDNELLIMNKWLSSRNGDTLKSSSSPIKDVKGLAESISRSEKRVYSCLLRLARSTPSSKNHSDTEKHV